MGTVVVVTVKVAEVVAGATAMEGGAERVELVLERVTAAPPAGAALVSVTVQELEELGPRMEGLQASEETRVEAAVREMVAFAELLL